MRNKYKNKISGESNEKEKMKEYINQFSSSIRKSKNINEKEMDLY